MSEQLLKAPLDIFIILHYNKSYLMDEVAVMECLLFVALFIFLLTHFVGKQLTDPTQPGSNDD